MKNMMKNMWRSKNVANEGEKFHKDRKRPERANHQINEKFSDNKFYFQRWKDSGNFLILWELTNLMKGTSIQKVRKPSAPFSAPFSIYDSKQ